MRLRPLLPLGGLVALALVAGLAVAAPPPASGPLAPELAEAFERGLFEVEPRAEGLAVSAAPRDWLIPIIRVAFSDSALAHPAAALAQRLFDTTGVVPSGSMAEYYAWASRGRLRVRGEVVATVTLPRERNFYAWDSWGVNAIGTPNNSYGLFRDALAAADPSVDFTRFDQDRDGFVDMVWIVHAGPGGETTGRRRDLWSITSRASSGWNNATAFECDDRVIGSSTIRMRADRFTILPELSGFRPGQLSEIGVYCHEFGHLLGLPDLYDTATLGGSTNLGPGNWSLMSTGTYGGDGLSPESPAHLGAWPLLWLGWADRVRPSQDTTLVLAPVADGGPIVEVAFQGEDGSEHLLIENRVRGTRFDRQLPGEGLIVQQVDEAIIGARIGSNNVNSGPTPGLRILEADGDSDLAAGLNRGDANDPFPGQTRRVRIDDHTRPSTRSLSGAPTNVALSDMTRIGTDAMVRVRVRAPGWDAPAITPGDDVLAVAGPGTRAVVAPAGHAWRVSCESDGVGSAILLRERPWQGEWSAPQRVDLGHGTVREPTLAWLGGDDLAVAWIGETDGPGQVRYRARVRGRWGSVHTVSTNAEGCLTPAIAADARGRVFLSWLEAAGLRTRLRFLSFLYTSPFGSAGTLTGANDLPTAPAVTAAGNGRAYVAWPDLGTGSHVLWACRFHPDSGLSARFRLTPVTLDAQPSVSLAVDTAGVLHSVWQSSAGNGGEIHYQRRQPIGRPSQRDTTLDAIGTGLQNPRIVIDPAGGLHVAYERLVDGYSQVRYKRWRPDLGWDHRATEVSDDPVAGAGQIDLLATSWGNLSVLWNAFDGQRVRLRQRERRLDGAAVTAVESAPSPAPRGTLGPNPLRAGRALAWSAPGLETGDTVELVDVTGRRVADTRAHATGHARFEGAATRSLAPGLYFVRTPGAARDARVVVVR